MFAVSRNNVAWASCPCSRYPSISIGIPIESQEQSVLFFSRALNATRRSGVCRDRAEDSKFNDLLFFSPLCLRNLRFSGLHLFCPVKITALLLFRRSTSQRCGVP